MEVVDRSIRLREHGSSLILTARELEESGLLEACLRLAAFNVIAFRQNENYYEVRPLQYVGVLRLPGRSIRIEPRFPGVFAAIRRYLLRVSEKSISAEEREQLKDDLQGLDPAVAFGYALEDAVGAGVPFSYVSKAMETVRPRGRLMLGETIRRFSGRGVTHKTVCRVGGRMYDRRICDVIRATCLSLRQGFDVPLRSQLQIDRLGVLFDSGVEFGNVGDLLSIVRDLEGDYFDRKEMIRLLRICRDILKGEELVWDFRLPVAGGESRFCDTDNLWEKCVYHVFSDVFGDMQGVNVSFHPLSGKKVRLFGDGGPEIDPDVVAFNNDKPAIIIDAKHSMSTAPVAGDVYQITCYMWNTKAPVGCLAYLSESQSWGDVVGAPAEGAKVFAGGAGGKDAVEGLIGLARQVRDLYVRLAG